MKYTVILDSSVPEDLRAALTEQLTVRFGLAPEQAAKLAARKAGRLLKPTSMARAETLLGVYQSMGLGVKLQEVADDEVAAPVAAVAAAPVAVAAAAVTTAVPVAPAEAPAVDPGWADFTGSLNLPGTPKTEESAPRRERRERTESGGENIISPTFTEVPETAAVASARRENLGQRITLTALLPVISTAVVTLGFLAFLLPRTQTTLIRQGAQAVAAAVGTNVDVTDQDKVDNQLRALVKQPSVGFVQVVTPDGLNFFKSKDEAQDAVLGQRVDGWVAKNPGDSSFVNTYSPAESAREQIKQLKDAGLPDDNPAIVQLQEQVKTASKGTTTNTYELVRLAVHPGR